MNEYTKEMIKEASFGGKAVGLTSKMWIMRTGKVLSTGSNWHFRWAFANKKMLEKDFGISFDGITPQDEEQKVRVHLIKQGMFRVNHETRGNRVTIEGLAKYYNRRVKDSILGLVMDNEDDFAFLTINLFDETAENIVKRKSANFFNIFGRDKIDKASEVIMEKNKYKTEEELIWESYAGSISSGVKQPINSNLITESSLSRIFTHIEQGKRFGLLSWSRAGMSPSLKKQAYKKLKETVTKLNYGFIEAIGGYGENKTDKDGNVVKDKNDKPIKIFIDDEDSLFIPDLELKDAIKLGSTNNGYGPQDSVLYSDGASLGYIITDPKNADYKKYDMTFKYAGLPPEEIASLAKKDIEKYFSRLKKGSQKNKKFAFVPESKNFRLCELGQIRYPKSKNNPNWKWDDYGYRIL